SWLGFRSSRAVEARPAAGSFHRSFVGVGVGDYGRIHPVHRGIVVEGVPDPSAAIVTMAAVAVTVIDSTVEAYGRAPVTLVKSVEPIVPSPISGGPEETDRRGINPRAGNPVVAVTIPSPVARRPN